MKIKSCVLVFCVCFSLFFGLSFCAEFFAFIFCCGLVWCVVEWSGLLWFCFVLFFSDCVLGGGGCGGGDEGVRRCE